VASDQLLSSLRALAIGRKSLGDYNLMLRPNPTSEEQYEQSERSDPKIEQGLVLEPKENAPFEIRLLGNRKKRLKIAAFCDGIRSTYFLGYENNYPILYARNASAIRTREEDTGYHGSLHKIYRQQATLLAPFDLFPLSIRSVYERMQLYTHRSADLCWTGLEDEENGPGYAEMAKMTSQSWQMRARRRARHLLDLSEQITSIAGAYLLRETDSPDANWLLKDGSLVQFKREYLHRREPLRNIVSCVKTHPVAFFGIEGERKIMQLEVGQRSVAFLPRPLREAQKGFSLEQSYRPMVSWYLRVRPPNPHNSSLMSGIIRLDIAAIDDWTQWIDEVSWAVLDEFYGISAMPDTRYDVMPYGIYDCERFLKAQQIPGDLLLAQLR
jgi:hypothetical protein